MSKPQACSQITKYAPRPSFKHALRIHISGITARSDTRRREINFFALSFTLQPENP